MILHLSANSRLSAHLKVSFARQADAPVVATPLVMTWSQWWAFWQDQALLSGELSWSYGRVISAFEATHQWSLLLEKHSPTPLLNLADTAKQLYQAWCLWVEYGASDETAELELDKSQEWQLFSLCRDDYQAWLSAHNWLDETLLMQQRLAWFKQGVGECPSQINWQGFDELTPFMNAWWSACEARGASLINQSLSSLKDQAELSRQAAVYSAADPRDEAQQVAAFCVTQLSQALQQSKPLDQIRIGVVAPNLEDVKAPLSYWLDDQLFQQFESHPILAEHSTDRLYNISLGTTLSRLPYIQFIQQTLSMAFNPHKSLAFEDFSQWLISPFCVGDQSQRHALDRSLRRLQWAWIKWPELVAQTESDRLSWPKNLAKFLAALSALKFKSTGSLNQFVEQVQICLDTLGAFRQTSLSSDLFQQHEKFIDSLAQFASLQGLQGQLNMAEWLGLWQRFCSQTLHQAQSTWIQPIQVMGMLEAGGQTFDALWVMGLDDEAWPRPAQPNAFLPLRWQRQNQLPRCDASRELEYARRLTTRLAQSAEQVVMSYAKQKGEAMSMPSPLINVEHWPSYQALNVRSTAHQAWCLRPACEMQADYQAPEVADGVLVPGGSGMLSAQMKCPLMAFMDYRLGAKYGLESVEDGLASTDQGSIMHSVLEHFWQQTKTQVALISLDETALTQRLQTLLDAEFEPLEKRFAPSYVALEKARMLGVLQDWMTLEKTRPTAFEVVATEQGLELEIAQIKFRISIDRIDATEIGQVLIDYKTGQASLNDLLKEPIRAPQLAVYLLAVAGMEQAEVAGLGYGLLSSDKGVRWSLISEDTDLIGKGERAWSRISQKGDWLDVSWPEFLDFLQDQVTQLAQDVKRGFAPMWYEKDTDLAYSPSLLALRVPEVKSQIGDLDTDDEAEEASA